ncbi:hypothetical protein ACSFCX_06545 [Yokenella regensburgei]|uniref:hypothetical protein n=1 Tax=Yokenella regensburgei TaxID=158877 RepID=UPI003ED89FE1
MPNPMISQGTLNRVRCAVGVTDHPELNITAPFLGKDMVSLRPDGNATDIIPTATGTVGSHVPYQQVTLTVHLLKTQYLAASYQNRILTDTSLGEVVVRPDANTFGNYTVLNAYIVSFNELTFSGADAGYVLTISGYIITNNNMWD